MSGPKRMRTRTEMERVRAILDALIMRRVIEGHRDGYNSSSVLSHYEDVIQWALGDETEGNLFSLLMSAALARLDAEPDWLSNLKDEKETTSGKVQDHESE